LLNIGFSLETGSQVQRAGEHRRPGWAVGKRWSSSGHDSVAGVRRCTARSSTTVSQGGEMASPQKLLREKAKSAGELNEQAYV